LPGLLQAQRSSRRVRQFLAGILYHRGPGVRKAFTTKDTKVHEGKPRKCFHLLLPVSCGFPS
jgi:hypothetical protein